MSDDPLDRFMRGAVSPMDVSADRVDRITDGVFARLDALPQQKPQTRRRLRLVGGAMGPSWVDLVGRFGVPMATAAALGLVIGSYSLPHESTPQLAELFAPTYLASGR